MCFLMFQWSEWGEWGEWGKFPRNGRFTSVCFIGGIIGGISDPLFPGVTLFYSVKISGAAAAVSDPACEC